MGIRRESGSLFEDFEPPYAATWITENPGGSAGQIRRLMAVEMQGKFIPNTYQILVMILAFAFCGLVWAGDHYPSLAPSTVNYEDFSLSDLGSQRTVIVRTLTGGIGVLALKVGWGGRESPTFLVETRASQDRAGKSDPTNTETWYLKLCNQIREALIAATVEALVTVIIFGLGGFIFFKYVVRPPDLSGCWKFTVEYENTAYSKFSGLQVTYQVLLIQQGLKLSGTGEKLSDRGPIQDAKDYVGKYRTKIQIVGNVTHNYFSRDVVALHYDEGGERRKSSTVHRLVECGGGRMSGCFWSTIANTSGPVWWERCASSIDYEPVTPPGRLMVASTISDRARNNSMVKARRCLHPPNGD